MTQKTVTAQDALLAFRNPDGAWGYASAKSVCISR